MIQNVKGTKDILPDTISIWHFLEDSIKKITQKFGYNEIRTPIFEFTDVFSRSIGDSSDIVNKEMYSFEDRSGKSITLRPEMTAALVRSIIQNGLANNGELLRLWYYGPFFRYERPQKGRQRQFHQFGVECVGSEFAISDFEVIQLADKLVKSLGIKDYNLIINSIGNENSRNNFRKALVEYFSDLKDNLSEDSKMRLVQNPLRILDSKDPNDKSIIDGAPIINDYLDEESQQHYFEFKDYLDTFNITYQENHLLVRGLDYYNHTVFEFQSLELGAQDSFGGGGRYDGLIAQLGGKQTPAVGFAMGVERLILILTNLYEQKIKIKTVKVINQSTEVIDYSLYIANKLRELDLNVQVDLQRKSMKAQMKNAGKQNSDYCVIIGDDEKKNRSLTIKDMRIGSQKIVYIEDLNQSSF